MTRSKRNLVGKLADQVRDALRLPDCVNYDDLEKAVARLGGGVKTASMWNLRDEASIRREGDSFIILLDGRKPEKRKLFSLAHEIGHLFLHMAFGNEAKWNLERDYVESYSRSGYNEEEYEANEFAGALLMPEAKFKSLHRNNKDVNEIADFFNVSVDAAQVRGRWLGLYKW